MIDLASASASLRLDVSNFVTNAQRAADAANGIKQATDNATSGGFLGWVTDNEAALNRWGKGLLATGAIITGAFTAPVIAGSRAAWNQVDAVEQATVAMRAYVDDAEKVDQVLADLVAYARSDLGVLFQRQDLFEAAQSMLIYGASIDEVTGYVEIMSRSVGLGTGNWQDLNRIIGRIGSTGKITRDDFDMLTKAGYQLDSSIVGQTVTWQELFAILDQGIPADALAGQADTIRGKTIRLQSALRGLGLAFLGVDSETSKFIEGGLGWQMMRGMERLRSLFIAAAPAVGRFGDILAAIGRPLGQVFDLLLRLPQPVQTAMLMFTAASGALMTFSGGLLLMLPRIASTVAALSSIAPAAIAAGTAMMGAIAPALPVILAVGAAIAALGAAFYVLYQSNFMGFADFVDDAIWKVGVLWDAIQLAFGSPHHNTGHFDINTTADNVWDQWQLQADGTWKHVELDISSTADDGSLEYMGYDENTGKWVVMHISSEGEIPGEIVSSSKNPSDPTKYYWEIQLDDGGTVRAIYDEVDGTIQLLEAPHEMNVDTRKARSEMNDLERAANDIGLAFWALEQLVREMVSWIAMPFDLAINLAIILEGKLNDIRGVLDAWQKMDWHDKMDLVGLGGIADGIQTIIDLFDVLIWAAGEAKSAVGDFFGGDDSNIPETVDRGGGITATPRLPRGEGDTGPPRSVGQLMARGIGINTGEMVAATAAATLFAESMYNLDAASLRSNQSLMKTASTVPMFTSSTREADQATGAMAGNMNRSFSDMARSALTNFTSMQSTATSSTSSMQSSVIGSILGMQTRAAAQMALMSSTTGTQTANMQSTATTNASTMASQVGSHMLGMRTAAALQMGLMASSAATTGSEMNTGMIGWMAGAITRVAANMGLMVGAVRNAAGPGYDAGYYAGSMIGAGMAAGMNAYLGQIRASANAMVAAASTAVIARAMISSPSRLFMQYGEYIGEGLEIGMRNMIPQIGRAASDMIPQPAFNTPIGHGGYGGTTVIDNSTHTTEYIALTESDFQQLLAKTNRANNYVDARQRGAHRGGYERSGR